MDNAGNARNGVVAEDGAESICSTATRGPIKNPIGYIAQFRSRILSVGRPAGKGMKGHVASTIGSNSKDGAEVIRPAIIGNAIQITVTVTGQTRHRGLSIGSSSEGIQYGLHTCRSHLVDGTQIIRSARGSGSIKIAIGGPSQSLWACATTVLPEGIQHRFNSIEGDLEESAKPQCSPLSRSRVKRSITPQLQT